MKSFENESPATRGLVPAHRRAGPTKRFAGIGVLVISLLAALALANGASATTTADGARAVTPPTVLLGTADQFAVLAGSGITNTGVTTISGDVGSSPTSTQTGFDACPAANCVTLTGANHTDPDP